MKRIVLVAPGVEPPLTEGRKLFVIDLAEALNRKGFDAEIVNGEPIVAGMQGVRRSLHQLEEYSRSSAKIDAIAIFPYGTFTGIRRFANQWFVRRARTIAHRAGIPVLPVFYSSAGLSVEDIGKKYAPALAIGRSGEGVDELHLGISREMPAWVSRRGVLRNLLFLCGYQKPTQGALDDVLYERGLIDLLRAGNTLADAGLQLTIAIPFLGSPAMQSKARELANKICPRLPIDLRDSVDPASVFNEHDLFVFPYRTPHAVFVPTSLLEAMSVGIPVIAADHAMYRALTLDNGIPRCGLHRIGDHQDLAQTVLAVKDRYGKAVDRSKRAAKSILSEWNIDVSADEFIAAFSSPIRAPH